MNAEQIQVGQAQAYRNVSGTRVLKYTVEMFHKGLNEHKLLSAPEIDMLQNKANFQAQKWTEKWNLTENRRSTNQQKEANIEEAASKTEEAIEALKQLDNLLLHTLSVNDAVDWERLKKREIYSEKKPEKPVKRKYREYPYAPKKESPSFTFIERLILKS
ncbi:MAG: hypothetical protein WC799_04690 [Desulfobacteraceae bacterium]|jgi:restriction system protein